VIAVASGKRYERFATQLLASAKQWFLRDTGVELRPLLLPGRAGWPAASLNRYDVILEHADRFAAAAYVFHLDADALFVAPVGNEVLAPLLATRHPNFIGRRGPYESRPESSAYVSPGEGVHYYCGHFNGGERAEFLGFAEAIRDGVRRDAERGIVARWHDESHVNRYLVTRPPDLSLSPSYVYPEGAVGADFQAKGWPEPYEPKILALEKPRVVFEARERRLAQVAAAVPALDRAYSAWSRLAERFR